MKTLPFVLWVDLGLFATAALVAACVVTEPVIPGGAASAPPADPARLEASVRMLAERFHPRDASHVANLDAAAAWIDAELAAAGGRVSEQTWVTDGETYRNVLARFGPESSERVVVGAHYDVCDPLPGADDNASGVAGLLELARMLGRAPPRTAVELVAYSLEEPPYFATPHMGSAHHAAALAAAGVHVRAMLSLEMLGYFSDAPDSQGFPSALFGALYPSRGDFIALVGNLGQGSLTRSVKRAMRAAGTVPVESINAPQWLTGIDFSDHRSYWEQGFPALMVTDTSFYRNPNYHEATDTPETLDYARLARVVSAVHSAVQALAAE
ncbi:MAG TPA: M28 family peptidase [Myxococcota bacterium]|nr:M28 family peptidase [Myxococcota bacterium]